MQHYSCDLCGKDLTDGLDSRFVLKMEVFAANDLSEISEYDLGNDHLEEMGQLLRDADEMDLEPAPAFKKMRFDMCSSCHRKFLADPLNREAQKLDFSVN